MTYKELNKLIELIGDKKLKDLKIEEVALVKGVDNNAK